MEIAMNDTRIPASAPYPIVWPGAPPGPVSHARYGLGTLCNILATWEDRKRFRLELARLANDNPHLIADIGLTRRQVEAEIAKPFWRA